MSSGDPVSWFLIEPGWKVIDANGKEAGRVEETVGDANADIFNGLSISVGLLKGNRYVPAEQVGRISEGEVHLKLTREELDSLDKYERPAASEQILPPDRN
jgi:Uncharacterized protein conserved in bacteria (DUF2171)